MWHGVPGKPDLINSPTSLLRCLLLIHADPGENSETGNIPPWAEGRERPKNEAWQEFLKGDLAPRRVWGCRKTKWIVPRPWQAPKDMTAPGTRLKCLTRSRQWLVQEAARCGAQEVLVYVRRKALITIRQCQWDFPSQTRGNTCKEPTSPVSAFLSRSGSHLLPCAQDLWINTFESNSLIDFTNRMREWCLPSCRVRCPSLESP